MVDKIDPVLGRTALSDFHRQLHVDGSSTLKNWIPSGFTPTDGGALNLDVLAGRAFLAGAIADRDVTTVLALTDATTNHVWVFIDDSLDDGVVYFLVNTTGVAPTQGPFHKIATVTTAGGGITLITDLRLLVPEISGALRIAGLLQALADLEVTGDFDLLTGKVLSDATILQLRNLADSAYKDLSLLNLEVRGGDLRTDASEMAIRNLADSAYKDLHVLGLIVDGLVDGVDVADHSARHEAGGADVLAIDAAVGLGSLRTLGLGALQAKPGNAAPLAHDTSHEPGGGDAMAIDAAVGIGSLRTLGTGGLQGAPGDHSHGPTGILSWGHEELAIAQGSPTAAGTFPKRWDLSVTGTDSIFVAFKIPDDWDGSSGLVFVMYADGSNSNGLDVKLLATIRPKAEGEDPGSITGQTQFTPTITNWGQYFIALHRVVFGTVAAGQFAAGDIVFFEAGRLGSDGADDYTGNVRLWAIGVEYTASH